MYGAAGCSVRRLPQSQIGRTARFGAGPGLAGFGPGPEFAGLGAGGFPPRGPGPGLVSKVKSIIRNVDKCFFGYC